MIDTLIIWIICSAAILLALIFIRAKVLHRRVKLRDLDWKSVVVISMLLGAAPAFYYDQTRSRNVQIPETLEEHSVIPA